MKLQNNNFYDSVKTILQTARDNAYKQVNFIMVEAYWNIGKQIVEEEQKGEDRAKYGSYLIKELSKQLSDEFGKGFSQQSIRNMRQFYNCFPIRSTLWSELSWSHYKLIIRLKDESARAWYMEEAVKSHWSVRALDRQIGTHYYERLLSSRHMDSVKEEAKEKTKGLRLTSKDIIKDPYVLEFLDLQENKLFHESEVESALIEKIQAFLLELGRGFAFVDRQKRIKTEHSDFYIDLVFYNYILKCFVVIDLKRGKLTHQDVGQMDMYVRMFDDLEKSEEDNPTIGIILCTEKDNTVVKYSVIDDSDNLFVSKYQLYLPTQEELKAEIEKDILELELKKETYE
ncbi:MAG: PDDEXK nuclease domain-containing protein [Epsilonproteobacteria bacterium]|nr:PDDEXK nuclease domain-containing protein [Campylobacterota bacterium]